jgi:di/tricarboxylate transporter
MLPGAPDAHAIACMLLAGLALFMFSRDRIPLEATGLGVLLLLLVGFYLFPYEVQGEVFAPTRFLAGFGNSALITILALLICAKGLEATGALQPVAQALSRNWVRAPKLCFLVTLVLAAGLSMFLNNTPLVAMLLPILVTVCLRTGVSPSGVLMPVGYATIIGGMSTTIGTSTNLLVVGLAADFGLREFGMFDFFLPAVIAGSVGILFLWLIAPKLLPARTPPMPNTSPRAFRAMFRVMEGSFPAERTLMEVLARTDNRMRIGRIERGQGLRLARLPNVRIMPGDRIYVVDTPENLKEFEALLNTPLFGGPAFGERVSQGAELDAGGQRLAEIVVRPGSPLDGQRLENTDFFEQHRLLPLAVHRPRESGSTGADPMLEQGQALRGGDVILVQGTRRHIRDLQRGGRLLVLDGQMDLPHTEQATTSVVIVAGVIVLAAFGILPIAVGAVCGVAAMLVTRCLNWDRLHEALDRKLVMVIVAALALGQSLFITGGTDYLAQVFVVSVGGLPVPVVLAGLMLMWALLTELVTNNAAAVLGVPIAIAIARQLGVDPEPFVLGVLFASNMSYLTPMGYQTNLLVLSAGGYRFSDFFRVGIPLQIIVWLALAITLPLLYDLGPLPVPGD